MQSIYNDVNRFRFFKNNDYMDRFNHIINSNYDRTHNIQFQIIVDDDDELIERINYRNFGMEWKINQMKKNLII